MPDQSSKLAGRSASQATQRPITQGRHDSLHLLRSDKPYGSKRFLVDLIDTLAAKVARSFVEGSEMCAPKKKELPLTGRAK